jgi:hypothetical protein
MACNPNDVHTKYDGETLIYYADLTNTLGYNTTISSVSSVTSADSALTLTSAAVLGSSTTVLDRFGATHVIAANKGVSFQAAGGTAGVESDEYTAVIVVTVLTSNGETIQEPFRIRVLSAAA